MNQSLWRKHVGTVAKNHVHHNQTTAAAYALALLGHWRALLLQVSSKLVC
jgi:hypothetical protein